MIDRLYINDIDVQDRLGFWLEWKIINYPTVKTNYQSIAGADSVIDLTEANGQVYYNQRSVKIGLIHPEKEYQNDLDSIIALHGDVCRVSFASDPTHYFVCRLIAEQYSVKDHKLNLTGDAYPYRFEKQQTVYTVKSPSSITLLNDAMPVVPKIEVIGESATIQWLTYTKVLSSGVYYVDELKLGKKEALTLNVSPANASTVKITYRKGRI
jgi:hypothetical protein